MGTVIDPERSGSRIPMKTTRFSWRPLGGLLLAVMAFALGGCASPSESGAGMGSYPDPAQKQYQLQEKMSQVTRSFIR